MTDPGVYLKWRCYLKNCAKLYWFPASVKRVFHTHDAMMGGAWLEMVPVATRIVLRRGITVETWLK